MLQRMEKYSMDELPFLVVLIRRLRTVAVWTLAIIFAVLLYFDFTEDEYVAAVLTSVFTFLIFVKLRNKKLDRKFTHEIKIPKSIVVVLYAILFVLTLNLASPFFNVKTASAFSNEVHKIAICHPVHFTRCAEIKDGVLMAGFYN